MTALSKCVCIVGGGLGGMFAALRVRQLLPDAEIHLLEESDAVGGLMRSDLGPGGLHYDRGTHILSETGDAIVDALLFGDLDHVRWSQFGGTRRDRCGLLMEATVQESSPFLAVPAWLLDRQARPDQIESTVGEVRSLDEYLAGRFGQALTKSLFGPVIHNLYQCTPPELDVFVAKQLPLLRVIIDDMHTWTQRADDPRYRARFACPDQDQLPAVWQNPAHSFYPKAMGIAQFVAQLRQKMQEAGVQVWLDSKVFGIEQSNGRVSMLRFSVGGALMPDLLYPDVVWAAPVSAAARHLGLPVVTATFGVRRAPVFVDGIAKLRQSLSNYYYYDYGAGDGFRLTNYGAFCDEASALAVHPFTYELWLSKPGTLEAEVRAFVTNRFLRLGLISDGAEILDMRLRSSVAGVPIASLAFMDQQRAISAAVAAARPQNFLLIGLFSQPNLFFMSDILRHARVTLDDWFA